MIVGTSLCTRTTHLQSCSRYGQQFRSLQLLTRGIQVQAGHLGNVFLTNEISPIPLTSNGTEIRWKVTDYFGNTVAEGRRQLTSKRADHSARQRWSRLF